ncbi:PduM family microcompartment protein [Pediococcus acidilactici]|uniref:PduM family microcompartment protein n=1 Tax=Pediococcus acidilactici TaxID=1254 RepID=UPI0018A93EFF|nr:PduM family microcompartment protein [Pediococcus acidilactici]
MDPIVAQVIEKLKQRNAQSAQITYSKSNDVPSTGIFVDNANLVLKQVSIELIADLFHLDQSNRWVTWILQGLDYDVNFQLNVSYHALNFIPLVMIRDWPIMFVVNGEHPVYAFYPTIITREMLAGIPDKAVVVVTNVQNITAGAEEISSQKDLKIQVRTDENCIWQKL